MTINQRLIEARQHLQCINDQITRLSQQDIYRNEVPYIYRDSRGAEWLMTPGKTKNRRYIKTRDRKRVCEKIARSEQYQKLIETRVELTNWINQTQYDLDRLAHSHYPKAMVYSL